MTEKKERVLTEKEQARLARFEQTAAEMMEKGYRRVNLTVDIVKANIFALGMMVPVFIMLVMRLCYRRYREWMVANRATEDRTNALIIGAGDAGVSLIREMLNTDKINYYPICLIDDNDTFLVEFSLSIKSVYILLVTSMP